MGAHNSVLIDISAVVDIETTLFNFILDKADFKDDPEFKNRVAKIDDNRLLCRIYNDKGLLRMIFHSEEYADIYKFLSDNDKLLHKKENEILDDKYVSLTDIKDLIKAYEKTGGGIIKTTIRCNNDIEAAYIKKKFPTTTVITTPIEEINIHDEYSRVISGDIRVLLKANYGGPKSIVVMNYRENFMDNDATILRPELITSLGDIHDINVMIAYAFDMEDMPNNKEENKDAKNNE